MKTKIFSSLLICMVFLQLSSFNIYAKYKKIDPPIYAQIIQTSCIRETPSLTDVCIYNISQGKLSILIDGAINFYKVDYYDGTFHHIGWIWYNRVVLIYP